MARVPAFPAILVVALATAGEFIAVPARAASMDFDDRVAAQAKIERVLDAHRIGASAPFDQRVSRAALEEKVRRLQRLVERVRATSPITPAMIDAERKRIESRTKFPDRLHELYAALGDDPVRIEECLVVPALAARLAGTLGAGFADTVGAAIPPLSAPCPPEVWTPTAVNGAPAGRAGATAVWTGSEMIVWGGYDGTNWLGSGGAYDPVLDVWSPVSSVAAPTPRGNHTAVWTGARMLVWGGYDGTNRLDTGGSYDPVADQWTPTSVVAAPSGRERHTAVWTGTRMIVWGGTIGQAPPACDGERADGGVYDPATDTWSPVGTTGAPMSRYAHVAVWDGDAMIVWGGQNDSVLHSQCFFGYLNDGGRYDPASGSWLPVTLVGAPGGANGQDAVWTGSRMIVWGGDATHSGQYDPVGDTWAPVASTGAPTTSGASAVWSGSRMIVWGGGTGSTPGNGGALYDPLANSWNPTTTTGAPSARGGHVAVWDGAEMMVWGGQTGGVYLADGGRYSPGDPDSDGDGLCNSVDPCPADPLNDVDGDGICGDVDNCPTVPNPSQADADHDGIGDACDACPLDPGNDYDRDGVCGDVDNCNGIYNPKQLDSDGDGIGDLCDNCPLVSNPSQADRDLDGAGDACDCEPGDGNDRRPAEVQSMGADKSGTATVLNCATQAQADAYAFTRGLLSTLGPGEFGSCLVQGLILCQYQDSDVPPPGQGYFYLAQAQNYDCGMGPLGTTSAETERVNNDPATCNGNTFQDARPTGETTVYGTVSGNYQATFASDNVYEAITEVLSTSGPAASRYSRLEHRWTFNVPAGSNQQFHVEGFRTLSPDGLEDFRFEYSTDNGKNWTIVAVISLPTSDTDTDLLGNFSTSVAGNVLIRVVDTDHTPGNQSLETVTIDQLWIRVLP